MSLVFGREEKMSKKKGLTDAEKAQKWAEGIMSAEIICRDQPPPRPLPKGKRREVKEKSDTGQNQTPMGVDALDTSSDVYD